MNSSNVARMNLDSIFTFPDVYCQHAEFNVESDAECRHDKQSDDSLVILCHAFATIHDGPFLLFHHHAASMSRIKKSSPATSCWKSAPETDSYFETRIFLTQCHQSLMNFDSDEGGGAPLPRRLLHAPRPLTAGRPRNAPDITNTQGRPHRHPPDLRAHAVGPGRWPCGAVSESTSILSNESGRLGRCALLRAETADLPNTGWLVHFVLRVPEANGITK